MNKLKKALVITSIASPNAVLKAHALGAKANDIDFIVIGDTKSPDKFELDGCRFLSIDDQEKLNFKLATLLPKRHYARKNLGYLLAKDHDVIIETDDDNFPYDIFWHERKREQSAEVFNESGWVNVYGFFSKENIWPRGYPLHHLKNVVEHNSTVQNIICPIQQGLADENPDVDAVYRMTMKLPIKFDQHNSLALGKNSWSPFNSQNTTWFKEAFPLLYLPSYCSFRMTDIWRSFIAQRIAWTCNWPVMYHNSTVWQERNDHSLIKDFEDEIPGYVNNETICRKLEELELSSGEKNILPNLIRCYEMMTENNYIGKEEMKLVEAFCEDID
ncbi:MAG: DUF288 domain-containing protein [Bacteroidetes bacterium]|nr:DUF288 domain-containing protein [Bacteroidota bacterium]